MNNIRITMIENLLNKLAEEAYNLPNKDVEKKDILIQNLKLILPSIGIDYKKYMKEIESISFSPQYYYDNAYDDAWNSGHNKIKNLIANIKKEYSRAKGSNNLSKLIETVKGYLLQDMGKLITKIFSLIIELILSKVFDTLLIYLFDNILC